MPATPHNAFLPVILVQITSHPFISVENREAASEPFPAQPPLLATLANHGFPVESLRTFCRDEYFRWHCDRVKGIVEWLNAEFPALFSQRYPAVIVFPEGSIPQELLAFLADFCTQRGAIIVAGTHTFSTSITAPYADLNLCDRAGAPLQTESFLSEVGQSRLMTKSVVPVIFPSGRVFLRLKTRLSPYEFTEGSGAVFDGTDPPWRSKHKIKTIRVDGNDATVRQPGSGRSQIKRSRLRLCVHVCSECLQSHGPPEDIQLYVIPSYNRTADPFIAQQTHISRNQVPVLYCNDGAFGGSRIANVHDPRGTLQWSGSPREGTCPAGDCIVIAQVEIGRSATDKDVANASPHYLLHSVVPIVPEAASNPQCRVAEKMRAVLSPHSSGMSPVKPATLPRQYTKDTESALRDLLEEDAPSPVQRVLLEMCLLNIQSGTFSPNSFEQWCRVCRFVSLNTADVRQNAQISRSNASSTEGLSELERRLAAVVYSQLRYYSESTPGAKRYPDVVANAIQQCADVADVPNAVGLVDALWQEVTEVANESLRKCKRRLTHRLGALVEAFRGTSGWIFVAERDEANDSAELKHLVCVVSHNTPAARLCLPQNDDGMIAHVARTRRGYYSNHVVDTRGREADGSGKRIERHYNRLIASTRSEIAVPVCDAAGRVLAVVNIEANYFGAFNAAFVGLLQSEAALLAADIWLLGRSRSSRRRCVWDPLTMGWSVRSFLDRASFRLATALDVDKERAVLSCTYWHVDKVKHAMYVRGTTRFDYEYIASRVLPLKGSLLGEIALAGAGVVFRRLFDACEDFARPLKARRMELRDIVAVPFRVREDDGDNSADPSDKRDRGCADGVLAFYSYAHEYGHEHIPLKATLTDEVMRRIGEVSGRCIAEFHEIQREYAGLFVAGRLAQRGLVGYNAASLMLKCTLSALRVPAGTLFVRDGSGRRLVPIATTGLTDNGDRLLDPSDERCTYSIPGRRTEPTAYGLTVALALCPGVTLRKNDIPDPNERVALSDSGTNAAQAESESIRAKNKVREAFELSETEHRRFIGASTVRNSRGVADAVLRLNRGASHSPFIGEDENLLRAVAAEVGDVLAAETRRYSTQRDTTTGSRSGDAARKRLKEHWPALVGWNVTFIDSILHDVITTLKRAGAERAEIRVVTELGAGEEALAFLRQHSVEVRDCVEELHEEPVVRGRCNLAWKAVETGEILVTNRERRGAFSKLDHSGEGAERVTVYVPFRGFHERGRGLVGVLGVEVSSDIRGERQMLQDVACAAAKLSVIGVDNGWITRRVIEDGLSWLKCSGANEKRGRYVVRWRDGQDVSAEPHGSALWVGPVCIGSFHVDVIEGAADEAVCEKRVLLANVLGHYWQLRCAIREGRIVSPAVDVRDDGRLIPSLSRMERSTLTRLLQTAVEESGTLSFEALG